MKFLTQYKTESAWTKDKEAGSIALPNISLILDSGDVKYLQESGLLYYGTIPKSVVMKSWSSLTTLQIKHYLHTLSWNDIRNATDTGSRLSSYHLEISALEGDKIVVLFPDYTNSASQRMKSLYETVSIASGLSGTERDLCTDIFGTNSYNHADTVVVDNTTYFVYGEIVTVSGYYDVVVGLNVAAIADDDTGGGIDSDDSSED